MKGTEHFKKAIKAYLDERAGSDALFAASYVEKSEYAVTSLKLNEMPKTN